MEKLLTLISCFLLISCFTEPKSSNISEPMERKVENTVIPPTNNNYLQQRFSKMARTLENKTARNIKLI